MREAAALSVYPVEAETVTPRPARVTDDVTKLHVPLPYMISLIGIALAIGMAIWRIDTKISIIEVREQSRLQVDEANKRADTMLYENMKQSVDDLKRQTQLLQLQYAELQKQITTRK